MLNVFTSCNPDSLIASALAACIGSSGHSPLFDFASIVAFMVGTVLLITTVVTYGILKTVPKFKSRGDEWIKRTVLRSNVWMLSLFFIVFFAYIFGIMLY